MPDPLVDVGAEAIPDWEFFDREEDRIRGAQAQAFAAGAAAVRHRLLADDVVEAAARANRETEPGLVPWDDLPQGARERWLIGEVAAITAALDAAEQRTPDA